MTGPGDWNIPSDNVSAPPFIGPNDSGIILGPDVPPCMTAAYSAVFRFQPAGAATGGLDAPPAFYIGQTIGLAPGLERIDFGALIYDALTGAVCGWRVIATWQIQNRIDGLGTLWPVLQFGGLTTTSPVPLPAFFRNEFNFGDTSGAISPPETRVNFNKGDPLTRPPNPRNTLLTVDSVSIGRGLRAWVASQANSAAIGAEAVVLTLPTQTFFAGRSYVVLLDAAYFGSVANVIALRLRQTNLAGAIMAVWQHPLPAGAGGQHRFSDRIYLSRQTGGADLVDNLVITMTASAGTATMVGALTEVRSCAVKDTGDELDYGNVKHI